MPSEKLAAPEFKALNSSIQYFYPADRYYQGETGFGEDMGEGLLLGLWGIIF